MKTCKEDTIVIDGVEYEKKEHDFNKNFSEIKIPKGWRLWTADECMRLHKSYKNELNLSSCWFFIDPSSIFKERNDCIARFNAYSDWAYLGCGWGPSFADPSLGVRFARNVSEKKGKKIKNK